jgi:predicted nucleic acid-binding protein
MIFLDTGFYLALAQPKDQLHSRAAAWAKVIAETLVSTDYVTWETVNALSNPEDRPKAR